MLEPPGSAPEGPRADGSRPPASPPPVPPTPAPPTPAPPPPAPPPPWAERTFASLRRPQYRRFFLGHAVSLTGFWVRITAQGWLVYEITESKTTLGAVTALGLLPFVVLAPFGGVIADRSDRRWLLFWTQAIGSLVNVLLGIDVLLGSARIWHVALAALLVGSVRAMEIPVRNALVQDLVGPEDRSNAIGLNAAAFQLARVAGPALGGLLLTVMDTGACFLVVAALGAFNLVVLPGLELASPPTKPGRGGVLAQLAEGFRYVRGHRRTRTLLALVFVTFVSMWPYQTFLPAIAVDVLGAGDFGYGLLLAVTGVGALLGALWVAGRSGAIPATRNVVYGLVWAGALCVTVVGFARSVWTILPTLVVAGFCQVSFVATANTLVQESAPDDLRGRVMGIWTLVFGASYPLGAFVMGWVADHTSVAWSFAGGAGLAVVLTTWIRLRMPPRAGPDLEVRGRVRAEPPPPLP